MALESLPFRDRVLHEMTRLDERKRARDPHWNRYFLGIVCRDAIPAIAEGLASGMTEAEAYADAFTPTRETHAAARRLGLDLAVDRGRWVLPAANAERLERLADAEEIPSDAAMLRLAAADIRARMAEEVTR